MLLSLPFDLGATISGMLAFAGMGWFLSKRNINGTKKFIVASLALLAGLGAFAWYRSLLLAPEHATPGWWTEMFEFVLYCVAYFCFGALLSYVYWRGGPALLQMFRSSPFKTG